MTHDDLTRGLALHRAGRLIEAEQAYRALLLKDPRHFNALQLLGTVLAQRGDHLAAVDRLRTAITIDDTLAGVHHNLGNALQSLGRHTEAVEAWSRAIALDPAHADALAGKGRSLRELARWEEALACLDAALALRPDLSAARFARADALQSLQRFSDAASEYARVLELDREQKYAAGARLDCLRHACDWSQEATEREQILAQLRAGRAACSPFRLLGLTDAAEDQLTCARLYAADRCPPASEPLWRGERYAHRRLRVAYLSADFRAHATMFLMAELFALHDHRRFEWFAFSFGPGGEDAVRTALRSNVDHFVDVAGMTDLEAAHAIRTAEIDIAVDLKGYTQHCRPGILAHRPAPIQVQYLGYPGTMGAHHIDYLIADATLIPHGQEHGFSEKIVRLPDCYQPNDRRRPVPPDVAARAQHALPDTGFVFCCFNNSYKITPAVFAVWMRLLDRVEGSVLWLLGDNPEAMTNLRHSAKQHGIDPTRLVFAPRVDPQAHLARHAAADLFLDTLPVNAHTTASDALWAGLPLLTCAGASFASRVAASLLRAAGLPELITTDLASYEARALELARDPDALGALRSRARSGRATSALFDTGRLRTNLEAAFIGMHELHRQGLAPQSFDVSPGLPARGTPPRPRAPDVGERSSDDATVSQAIAAAAEGRHTDAIALLQRVLITQPDHIAALASLATSLEALQRLEEAQRVSERCESLCPSSQEIAFNHAGLLARMGRLDEAIARYARVVRERPEWASAHNNLGHALFRQGRYEEALAALDEAVARSPAFAQALQNRAAVLAALGHREAALAGFERVLAVDPENAQARTDRALQLLSLGRLREAWADLDHRWRNPTFTERHSAWPDALWWRGETLLTGRTLLIHAEQGLGDTLQFVRYLPMLVDAGARVVLQVQRPLQRLLAGLEGVAQVVSRDDPRPAFDLHCPMMSLPRAFNTGLETIPGAVPYLRAPEPDRERWAGRLDAELPPVPRVGLVWSGNPEHARDANRSTTLAMLSPLIDLPGLAFVSLQTQVRPQDEALLAAEARILDASPWLRDFADTAGLMENLDLVISVDTSPAHLAGALGLPVWLMLSTVVDWRWAPDEGTSRWYPSMRLFRQTERDDWPALIARVQASLRDWRDARPTRARAAHPRSVPAPHACEARRALVRAAALQRQGRATLAEALYRDVLAADPDNFDAVHMLGVMAAQQGRFPESEALLQRAVRLQASAPVLGNLGNTLDSLGQTDAALAAFDQALAMDPSYVRARLNRANVLFRAGRLDESLTAYAQALEDAPQSTEAAQGRARCLRALGADHRGKADA